MGQPHLKHCQSVTISISYSYLVSRTSRRSPVAQLQQPQQQTQRTQPQGDEEIGEWESGKRGRGDGSMGGAQLSGSAAKLITMMDYNTLYRCPLPARLSCLRGSFATSVCVSTTMWQAQAAAAATAALGPSASLNPSHVLTIYAVLSYLLWELSSKRGSEINLTA